MDKTKKVPFHREFCTLIEISEKKNFKGLLCIPQESYRISL